ncbi:MAG: retention module-containing protein [Limnobacter sp.]
MAITQVVSQARGVVAILKGNAWLVNADGVRKPLNAGDEVQEGQVIVMEDGTRLELALPNGEPILLASERELVIDANLLGTELTDKTEATLKNLNSGGADIAKILAAGGDLSNELAPTEAGLNGGESGEGHSFVRLSRISESLDQLSASRDAPPPNTTPDFPVNFATGPTVATIASVEPGAPGSGDDAVVEGTNLVYTVTLSNPSRVATSYPFSLGDGSATEGLDYTNTPTFSNGVTLADGVITVPAGVTSFTVTVPTIDDATDEPGADETLPLTVGGVTGTGAIIDNDNAPTISSVTSDTQIEGTALVHTVTLSNPSSVATSYPFSLVGGSATEGLDYTNTPTFSNGVTLANGVITVPAGVTSFTVTVPTLQDNIDEPAETIDLVVGGVAATGTIIDDDNAPTISSVTSDTQIEGAALVHTVTLSNPSSVQTSFAYSLGGGSATGGGIDYTTPPTFSNGVTLVGGNLLVPAGVTSFTITVPTLQDNIDEGASENYNLSVGGVVAVGTITDDDDSPIASPPSSITDTEDTARIFTWANFGISDADTPTTSLSVRVTSLPLDGVLQTSTDGFTWTNVAINQLVSYSTINAGNFRFVPDANESGNDAFGGSGVGNRQADYARFTFTPHDGVNDGTSATMRIDITPVADAPNLTVSNTGSNTPTTLIFNTSWETAPNNNLRDATGVTGDTFEGWSLIRSPEIQAGGSDVFEIWSTGDAYHNKLDHPMEAAPGNGNNWLELNDAGGGNFETIGISRTIETQAGQVYGLSLDWAGVPLKRLGSTHTGIEIQINGVTVVEYNPQNTSFTSTLDWKNLQFNFTGDGNPQTITIKTDATQFESRGFGAMIDDITLYSMRGTTAGNAVSGTRTDIALAPYITAALTDTDGSEVLSMRFAGLPTGAQIVSGANTYNAVGGVINISASELSTAVLRLDAAYRGNLDVSVSAVSTESANGSTASSPEQTIELHILDPRYALTVVDLNDGTNNKATGSDIFIGTDANNTLTGNSNANTISGLAGNDTLSGGGGNDILAGGTGNDTLTGGAGSDTFIWAISDRGTTAAAGGTPAADTIIDFNSASASGGGDILDLRDLLLGENAVGAGGSSSNLTDYLHFEVSGSNTIIHVSSTGAFGSDTGFSPTKDDQTITLTGVNLPTALGLGGAATDTQIIQTLLNNGKLITE